MADIDKRGLAILRGMAKYRAQLPQLGTDLFLTDGGLETTLIFHEGVDLPEFAAFVLLDDPGGVERLRDYFRRYMAVAAEAGLGFVAEAATWRANPDWAAKLGYDAARLADVNRRAIEMLVELRPEYEEAARAPFVVSGAIGPRGDGYAVGARLAPDEAERYHSQQIRTFAATEADLVTAFTMTHVGEAVGVARAAAAAGIPSVIGFTVETDGRLPSGQALGDAVAEVDAATGAAPAYYMVNCAHPTHFDAVLAGGESGWVSRVRALRANASRMSHAELDEAPEVDAGDPDEFGALNASLRGRLAQLTVLGGCCGTDDRHVAAIGRSCAP